MKINMENIQELFNLTNLENEILMVLLDKGSQQTVRKLLCFLSKRGKNIYRPLKNLVNLGLVEESLSRPKRFSIRNFEQKVINYTKLKIQYLQNFIGKTNNIHENGVSFFGNRNEYRIFGKKSLRSTRKSLDLIVSGKYQDSRFFSEHIKSIQRGIRIRCIITYFERKKQSMYENWQKAGVRVRFSNIRGVNVAIYDSRVVQIAVKESTNTRMKTGFAIDNKILGSFFTDYFNNLWSKSKKIESLLVKIQKN